jgi:hypothetical protein
LLRSLETGGRNGLYGGDGGVQSLLGGKIRARFYDRLDSLLLFRRQLDGQL